MCVTAPVVCWNSGFFFLTRFRVCFCCCVSLSPMPPANYSSISSFLFFFRFFFSKFLSLFPTSSPAQVVKCTGKFTPIPGFLHYGCPEVLPAADAAPTVEECASRVFERRKGGVFHAFLMFNFSFFSFQFAVLCFHTSIWVFAFTFLFCILFFHFPFAMLRDCISMFVVSVSIFE